MSELPEKLRPFEDLFRPEDYSLPITVHAGDTLLLEQALPPESWYTRARRLGRHALAKTLHARRTRSYGLGLGLGSTAIATGIAVAFFTANNSVDTAQHQPKTPQERSIAPVQSAQPSPSGRVHLAPVAKPSDIPPSLWPSSSVSTWEPTPTMQASASSKPTSRASKTPQPVAPSPSWSTMLPTVSQSPTNTESPTAPPTDGPTPSPEATDTTATEAWPETPPTALSPSPGG